MGFFPLLWLDFLAKKNATTELVESYQRQSADMRKLSLYPSAVHMKAFMAFCVCSVVFAALGLSAQQSNTASVTIAVKDPSGAPIPHAITRIIPALDVGPKPETDDKGRLTILLRPRDYYVVVESQGFRTSVTHLVVPDSSQPEQVSVVLQVGGGGYHVELRTAPSSTLTIRTDKFQTSVTFSLAELRPMSHITSTVHNSHTNADETYSGVRLSDLLVKMGAQLEMISAAKHSLITWW